MVDSDARLVSKSPTVPQIRVCSHREETEFGIDLDHITQFLAQDRLTRSAGHQFVRVPIDKFEMVQPNFPEPSST